MNEKKPSTDELQQRISELLNVLNMISRDLIEISKALREAGPSMPKASAGPAGGKIEEMKAAFPEDLKEMLNFEENESYIVIKPRQYLGSENFAKIASIVRGMGGEYVSAGKESHFRVPKI
jgi:hypothetical protein